MFYYPVKQQTSRVEQIRYNTRKHQTSREQEEAATSRKANIEMVPKLMMVAGNDEMERQQQPLVVPQHVAIKQTNSRIFNQKMVTLVLVSYLISSQSLTIPLSEQLNTSSPLIDGQTKVVGRSLILLAEAGPAPAPMARSATSASHRVPPINGSIFGKRSLADNKLSKRRAKESNRRQQEEEEEDAASSRQVNYSDIITDIIEDFMAQNNESK